MDANKLRFVTEFQFQITTPFMQACVKKKKKKKNMLKIFEGKRC